MCGGRLRSRNLGGEHSFSLLVEEEEVLEGCYFGPWLRRCEELSLIYIGGEIPPENLM